MAVRNAATLMRRFGLTAALLTSSLTWAANSSNIAFVACPILRDVPESSRLSSQVPCWMARYNGVLYYLGRQEDTGDAFHPPQQKHQVLVEGVVNDDTEKVCGGIPVKPIKISILQEVDTRCQEVIPADGFAAPKGYHDATPKPGVPMAVKTMPLQAASDGSYKVIVPFSFGVDSVELFSYFGIEALGDLLSHGQYHIQLLSVTTPALLLGGRVFPERSDITTVRARSIIQALHIMGRDIVPEIATESRQPSADSMANAAGRYVALRLTPVQISQ